MDSVPSLSSINRIEIYSQWVGFANPPSHSDKLTVTRAGDRFVRAQALESERDEVPGNLVSRVLELLSRSAVSKLDPALFDVPAVAIDEHYGSCWTDDSPALLIRITADSGRQITIDTDAQYAFMLPLEITDTRTGASYETFDPQLSQALADLMPEGFLNRSRLAGQLGMLDYHLEQSAQELDEGVEQAAEVDAGKQSKPIPPKANQLDSVSKGLLDNLRLGTSGLLERKPIDVRSLLAQGADPSVADDFGQTALMHADYPPFEGFRLLVEAGANLEARRRDGLTGLHLACGGGSADVAAEWIKAGADVTARTPEGSTPLMFGARWPRVVEILLTKPPDVNAVDDDGHNALAYSILDQCYVGAEGQLEAMRLLLEAGVDVNQRDRNGISPLGHAKRVLGEAILDEEVFQAFHPNATRPEDKEWNELRLAKAVVELLIQNGAKE